MDNLGKENFWNEMKDKYPYSVDVFCKWIDGYKNKVGWANIFGPKVKFHDIPYEMQMGIMNRFFIETYAGEKEYSDPEKAAFYRQEMVDALSRLNARLRPRSGQN